MFRIVPKFKKEKVQKHKTSPQPGMCSEITTKIVAFEQYVILCLGGLFSSFYLFLFFLRGGVKIEMLYSIKLKTLDPDKVKGS